MKLLYTLSFSVLLSVSAAAQKTTKAGLKDKAVIEHFKNDYKKKNYKKFTGQITVKDKQIVFDNKTVLYDPADKITTLLLKEGLVYPQLLTDFQVDKFENEDSDRTQKRFAKLQKNWKDAFDVNNIRLSSASEQAFLSSDPTVKRFKVMCKDPKFPNMMAYYFELTDKRADQNTSTEEFIKNAKLTHIFQRTE
ncbi:hypothetical protein QE422_002275 [Chryseobacterium sp. SORGH_AS 447]|uniref:hypothetical protein n=1 Tax=Chryseobacterium sp. SORGH_AS_0447 TaxID=3041769 RepID=UPI0027882A21|nr:hypothetical protein [Chryseobacterium sp. SORGH_AS_0447]MDQ1161907.1 hypothetical protein [Chryseobacterium sp. SORGH_AS_0447]